MSVRKNIRNEKWIERLDNYKGSEMTHALSLPVGFSLVSCLLANSDRRNIQKNPMGWISQSMFIWRMSAMLHTPVTHSCCALSVAHCLLIMACLSKPHTGELCCRISLYFTVLLLGQAGMQTYMQSGMCHINISLRVCAVQIFSCFSSVTVSMC